MDLVGKSPVAVPVLIIGKVALLACALFFLVKVFAVDEMLFDSFVTQVAGVILYGGGLAVILIALVQLGRSTAVGFPERQTVLKTQGLYRLTRNPIYVGAFIMCAGSCLFSIHLVNLFFFAIAVAVHDRIIAKEEEFLEERFGEQWLAYKRRVPRYVGRMWGSR